MKLEIELIPQSTFGKNVRSSVTKNQWDIIRSQVYSKAYNICEICGDFENRTEAHEIWDFNEDLSIQKLIGMIALCPLCHSTKHFGLSELKGIRDKVLAHLMKINKISKKKAEKYIESQFLIWSIRSKKEWKLDLSILKDYGIDI